MVQSFCILFNIVITVQERDATGKNSETESREHHLSLASSPTLLISESIPLLHFIIKIFTRSWSTESETWNFGILGALGNIWAIPSFLQEKEEKINEVKSSNFIMSEKFTMSWRPKKPCTGCTRFSRFLYFYYFSSFFTFYHDFPEISALREKSSTSGTNFIILTKWNSYCVPVLFYKKCHWVLSGTRFLDLPPKNQNNRVHRVHFVPDRNFMYRIAFLSFLLLFYSPEPADSYGFPGRIRTIQRTY